MERALHVEGRAPVAVHAEHRPHADQGEPVQRVPVAGQVDLAKPGDEPVDDGGWERVELVGLAIGGTAGAVGFGTWFLVSFFSGDGGNTDHFLSDRDAVLYTERYNRALVKKTVKDVQKSRTNESRIDLRPSIGLGSVGVAGRF